MAITVENLGNLFLLALQLIISYVWCVRIWISGEQFTEKTTIMWSSQYFGIFIKLYFRVQYIFLMVLHKLEVWGFYVNYAQTYCSGIDVNEVMSNSHWLCFVVFLICWCESISVSLQTSFNVLVTCKAALSVRHFSVTLASRIIVTAAAAAASTWSIFQAVVATPVSKILHLPR